MRWVTRGGLCLLAGLALAAATGASAAAEAPEFGRCIKQAKGKFKNAGCTTPAATGEERYEWFPGVVKNKFTTASKEGTLVTFESTGGTKIVCTGENGPGEYTGLKTQSGVLFTFTSCEMSGLPCTSAGQPAGTIVTASLEGHLGVVKAGKTPAQNKLGLEWSPPPGAAFAEFDCGPLKEVINGSVIVGVPVNKMLKVWTIKFTAMKGKQSPEMFEGGPPAVLELGGGERIGLTMVMLLTNEEKVEASSVN